MSDPPKGCSAKARGGRCYATDYIDRLTEERDEQSEANIELHRLLEQAESALAAKDDALTTLETQLTYALNGYGPQISLQAMIDLARTALGATQKEED